MVRGSHRRTSGACEAISHVLDVEGHRLEGGVQGQQDGGLVAFRTEACVSWGREAAHCCSQAFLPFWLESGLPLFGISHFCPGHPGFWLWVGGCCDTAWGSLMDFLSCLGPVAMAPSCRAWQGLGLGRKAVGACARPPASQEQASGLSKALILSS